MKTVIVFPDAMLAVLNILRSAMPAIRFGNLLPDDLPDNPVPYVMVRLDGSYITQQVMKTSTLRVSVWHNTEAEVLALAETLEAVLCAYPGGPEVRSLSPLTGAFPTLDSDNGLPLASFTLAARLRPTTL